MSEWQKMKYHSNVAIRKTAISFIFLLFIMLLSYVVSEYEYNNVKEQYQKAFNDANATFVQSIFSK
jgi:uncharacterized membrane protein